MLLDASEARIVSSLGWVDGASLWCYDIEARRSFRVPVADTGYLALHAGTRDHFAVAHHPDGGGFSVSVRSLRSPKSELTRASLVGTSVEMSGEVEAWANVPRAYAGYHPHPDQHDADYVLLWLAADGSTAELQWLLWFNAAAGYDLDWQGIVDAVEVPKSRLVLIPIQRSSSPAIYDPVKQELVGHISLAGRAGNPTLRVRGEELWADDYDTLLRLSCPDWKILDRKRLEGGAGGTMQFIGDWAFTRDGTTCAVARPFSSDVVALDTSRFRITHRARCGRQPLEVAVLQDGRVFGRDWKTGDLIQDRLRPIRRFFPSRLFP